MTTFITWNIQWGLGVDGRVDLERVAAVIGAMGGADVICLQEVGRHMPGAGGEDADQAKALAALFPGYARLFGAAVERAGAPGRRLRRFGNLILSRLPVLQVFRHPLPQPAAPGIKHMPRQATEAVVAAPWGPLRVTTTHLEYHSESQRLAQAERLRALHAEAAANERQPAKAATDPLYGPAPRPASGLVCGDLNLLPDDPVYRALVAPFADGTPPLIDAWRHARPDEAHAPTAGIHDAEQWPQGPHCRDFFLLTPDLAARATGIEVDPQTDASDHQPVRLVLRD